MGCIRVTWTEEQTNKIVKIYSYENQKSMSQTCDGSVGMMHQTSSHQGSDAESGHWVRHVTHKNFLVNCQGT